MDEFRGRVGSRQLARNTPTSQSERVQKTNRRSISEGGKPRAPSLGKTQRQSSLGSSREVRCACQFYMCDSLLPEKRVLSPTRSRVTSPVNVTRSGTPIENRITNTNVDHIDMIPVELKDILDNIDYKINLEHIESNHVEPHVDERKTYHAPPPVEPHTEPQPHPEPIKQPIKQQKLAKNEIKKEPSFRRNRLSYG